MVGQRLKTVNKPSRSDEVIDPEQQLQVAHEVCAHFESITPKRPIKPNRSEPDPDDSLTHHQAVSEPIPELKRLRDLQSQSQIVLSSQGAGAEQGEFVETEYYKQIDIIDKQHHTTGTGFIRIERENEEGLIDVQQRLSENEEDINTGTIAGYNPRSNPAKNDWIPRSEDNDQFVYDSGKPNRSG